MQTKRHLNKIVSQSKVLIENRLHSKSQIYFTKFILKFRNIFCEYYIIIVIKQVFKH